MIRSMTGFGSVADEVQGVHYYVELRSLNNRYFKAVMRLPEVLSGLEPELESQLRKRISRGSVTLTVKVTDPTASAAYQVNDEAIRVYLEHIQNIRSKISGDQHAIQVDLSELLGLPGVLQPGEEQETLLERARPVLQRLAEQACGEMEKMRDTEGLAVAQDLAVHRQVIEQQLELIAQRSPQVVEEYHERLHTRVQQLLARAELKVDESDLMREVAIFAERSDIAEEISRLRGHIEQMEKVMAAPDGQPAGRTLEFLSQEMLREANTIGSKSNDAPISRCTVEIKGAIDRIKEQAQNVE